MNARERRPAGAGQTAIGPAKRSRCPICGKPGTHDYRPFCSKHCADTDLGRWLGGRYAVPGEKVADRESDDDQH